MMKIVKNIKDYTNFSELLADAAKVFSDKTFLVAEHRECTFADFNRKVNKTCKMLEEDGVRQGDIVSIVLKNSLDYLLIYFATLRMGAKINPFPFHLGAEEVADKVRFIEPKIVYGHSTHAEKLKAAGLNVRMVQSDKENILDDLLEGITDEDRPHPQVSADETAFLYYSSGTTGSPKIIEYSLRSEIMAMASLLRADFMKAATGHLCVLPLGHTAAIRYTIWPCLLTGTAVVLFESFWKIRPRLWEIVQKHKVSFFEIVPSILIAILNTRYAEPNPHDLSSLKFIGCGSAYLPAGLQKNFEETFQIPLANMYGLSETGATHFDNPFLPGRKRGSIGKPFDIMDVRVFDENGVDTPAGQTGELGVKSESLLKGYYKAPGQYAACFKNGYFMTGDIGYVDETGVFYYIDRKKDLIIKGGVNIVPSQIDEALLTHESVRDAATIGKPDMFLGEVIKSYVVLKEEREGDVKILKTHCQNVLGHFKTPSEIEFVKELPKGPSGKILRRKLREWEVEKMQIVSR